MRAVKGNLATPPERDEKNEARLDRREQLGKERLKIPCARATRGLRRPSLDARREDQSAPIPEELTSKLGGSICNLVRQPRLVQPTKAFRSFRKKITGRPYVDQIISGRIDPCPTER